MRKILVYLAHPRMDRSEINTELVKTAQAHKAVTFVDLYRDYPAFNIDVKKEQDRLREHDVILFQHPVFWYSTPSIMKEWQDLVLEHGFAYGKEGRALEGKAFGQIMSAGAPEEAYTRRGINGMSITELFAPLRAMANLTHMIYLPPLVLYRSGYAADDDRLTEFQKAYAIYLDALSDTSKPIEDFVKHDDLIGIIRKFMGV